MLLVLSFTAMLLATLAPASATGTEPPNCAGPQQDMNRCAAATLAAEDTELNRRYSRAWSRAADPEAQRLLQKAQRAWIAFRDANCAWQGDSVRGGSLRPMLEAGCAEHMTRQRLLELSMDLSTPDPGLVAGAMIARLRDLAPPDLLQGVFWLPEATVQADFDANGTNDLAALALRPANAGGNGGIVHVLILPAGTEALQHAAIPIDGRALCAAPRSARIEHPAGRQRPLLVLDDATCGTVHIGLTAGQPSRLKWQRD